MKIFVDGYLLNKEYQGTRTYITELYKALAKLNPDYIIHFGVNYTSDELQDEFRDYENISFYVFKQKNKWRRMFSEYPKLSNVYDYMHFQYIIPFLKFNKKCKYINTVHDVLFLDFPKDFPLTYRLSRKILFGYSSRKADLLLTVSNYSKQRIAKHFNINENKIYITPNGVNDKLLESYNVDKVKKYVFDKYGLENFILYVSRIEPRKNQIQLLKLYAENSEVNAKNNLVFIGKQSLESTDFNMFYQDLDISIKNKITYIEQLPNSELINFYRAANSFVYPSLCEGFGIPPLEAAACGIPVLCNNKTAMQDFTMLQPYLVDFSSSTISELFHSFIFNNESPSKNIKHEIENLYTWQISAKQMNQLL